MPLALEVANMCVRDHINICWLIFFSFFFLFTAEPLKFILKIQVYCSEELPRTQATGICPPQEGR